MLFADTPHIKSISGYSFPNPIDKQILLILCFLHKYNSTNNRLNLMDV